MFPFNAFVGMSLIKTIRELLQCLYSKSESASQLREHCYNERAAAFASTLWWVVFLLA